MEQSIGEVNQEDGELSWEAALAFCFGYEDHQVERSLRLNVSTHESSNLFNDILEVSNISELLPCDISRAHHGGAAPILSPGQSVG